jgi:integrase/recombinase XerC/integrase/recombinase XerD
MPHLSAPVISSEITSPPAFVEAFLAAQDVRKHTLENYRHHLAAFFAQLPEGETVTHASISAWRDRLLAEGKSALSVGSYLSAVRVFFAWCNRSGISPNLAQGVKSPKAERRFRRLPLSTESARLVLASCHTTRARLLVELMLRAGLRGVELSRVNVEDRTIRAGRDVLHVQGKGRDDREAFVVLSPSVLTAWSAYLSELGPVHPSSPLFPSRRGTKAGERLSTRSIRAEVGEVLERAGVKERRVTAHSLRHTCAVELRRAGASLQETQRVLRHASSDTTALYSAFAEDEIRLASPPEMLLEGVF